MVKVSLIRMQTSFFMFIDSHAYKFLGDLRLEKQFGPYRETPPSALSVYNDKSKEQKAPKPLDAANRDNEHWNAYIKSKTEHFGDKCQ
jgi:hypothetical protein